MMNFFVTSTLHSQPTVLCGLTGCRQHPDSTRQSELGQVALANSAADPALVLANELALDNDGWALLLPFGDHPKERYVSRNGAPTLEKFIQVVDDAAVEEVLANERGTNLFARIKRAFIRRPVFKGHPDLKLHAPETLANDGALIPMGLVEAQRKAARGLETRISLTEDGARAVENEGCKYLSALVLVRPTGEVRDGATVARVFKILSVGLTPTPNISGVDSLANAKPNHPAASSDTNQKDNTMKQLIIGWLAAMGITLANDASDQTVLDALQKAHKEKADASAALGNEKTTLAGKLTALENEKATLTTQLAEKSTALTTSQTALANEQAKTKAERQGRAEALVDLTIAQGKLAVADRDAHITTLANAADFKAEAEKLAKLPVKFAMANSLAGERKADANATSASLALANAMEPHVKAGKSKAQALDIVLKDQPALVAAYREEGGAL